MTVPPDLTQWLRAEIGRLGFELVDARVGGPPRRRSVHLRIDRPDSRPGFGVTSDDCTRVSRALLQVYPTARPGEALESLEVSSPGLERPVRWPEHWRRFAGERVRLRARGVAGRPVAVILEVPDDEHVTLELPGGGRTTLALADITEATLVVDIPPRR